MGEGGCEEGRMWGDSLLLTASPGVCCPPEMVRHILMDVYSMAKARVKEN